MSLPNPSKSSAVILGVSNYSNLPKLPSVANNIKGLSALIQETDMWALPASRVVQLSDVSSSEMVMKSIVTTASTTSDTLLLYIAGHGLLDATSGDLYIGLVGSESRNTFYTSLPYEWIRRCFIEEVRAKRKIIILDCCYSGRAVTRMGPSQSVIDEADIEGTYILTATSANGMAHAPNDERYTAFTGELIDILNLGIEDGPKYLSLQNVFSVLRGRLKARSLPEPQQRNQNSISGLSFGFNRHANIGQELETNTPEGQLLSLARDSGIDVTVRVSAAIALAALSPNRAAASLQSILAKSANIHDADRLRAALVLLQLNRTSGRDALRDLQRSNDTDVVTAALSALKGDIRDGDPIFLDGKPLQMNGIAYHHWPSGAIPNCEA